MRLMNKVGIVTGAGSGNGRGIALRLAAEGTRVVVADIKPEGGHETVEQIEKQGGAAAFVRADVTSAADVRALVQASRDRFGHLDILVNNAGISPVGSVTEISEEDWDLCLNLDLKSVFLCCKYAIPVMIEGRGGSIINIAGTLGLRASERKASYCAAKAGVVNLTRQMAIDYGPSGIRVNCICPGFVDTPLTASVSAAERQRIVGHLPIARAGQVQDIGDSAVFLASEESAYVTGAALVVDGGQTLSIPA
jgi:NAD(P)-dependent dehydrogenase (short-subunit alcohol dehydrogenase family)